MIDRDWRSYLDKKVFHFAYFYVLWLAIEVTLTSKLGFKSGPATLFLDFAWNLVQPEGSLWFIYVLPLFFVLTKVLRRVPWPIVLACAASAQIAGIHTGIIAVDSGAERFVYFYAGYIFAGRVFAFAAWAARNARWAGVGLVGWGILNGTCVHFGVADKPVLSLALGGLGAIAVRVRSAEDAT